MIFKLWALKYRNNGLVRDLLMKEHPIKVKMFKTRKEALAHLETMPNKELLRVAGIDVHIRDRGGLVNRYI